jgi:adenylate cyclase
LLQGERRLAAIMLTDIVGYTALAQANEDYALASLEENRRLLRSIFPRFNGKEIKTIGDAFLVEFASALDAVRCSVDIQNEMHSRNVALPEGKRLELRVGIHLGDVVHSQLDILGDAVNVSSRIEPLAAPGGVCISEQVFDHVRNKIDLPLEKLGQQALKNVKMPIDVYRIVMPWENGSTKEESGLDPHRVAVLPLENMSPDPNDEYFADGMTEELITTLAGIKELTVIARTSVMQYKKASKKVLDIGRELSAGTVLEGSVRKAGNKVRITVQLIDARSDGHIWAQNYDRELDDIFAIQSEIAEKVAGTLRVKLLESERGRMESRQAADVGAYTLYLKGRHYWNERTKQGMEKAIEYFNAAIKQDPSFARGYSGIADCYGVMAKNGIMEPESGYRNAKEHALKAIELDPMLAEPHAVMAGYALYYERDPKKSEAEYRKAIELNPNYASAHQWYSHLLGFERRTEESTREIVKARELDPLSLIISVNFGDNLYYQGRFDEAMAHFQSIIEANPDFPVVYPSQVQACLRRSMFDEALKAADRVSELQGDEYEANVLRAYIFATMGRADEARRLLSKVEQEWAGNQYNYSLCYFAMGDSDKGFECLEKAYEELDGNMYQMGVDYELGGVRSDPRYLSLLRRLGLLS